MGVEPPLLYDHPSRYSFNGPNDKWFNPKAATIASWTPAEPKPKSNGPLVDFNKHPDSVGTSCLRDCIQKLMVWLVFVRSVRQSQRQTYEPQYKGQSQAL